MSSAREVADRMIFFDQGKIVEEGTPKRLRVVSVLLASTVLVKYPYGLIMGATVGVMEILRLVSAPGQFSDIWKRWFWLFGPFGAIMLIWFYQPPKVAAFFRYATLQPERVALLSVENLIYYPRGIALHYMPSPFFAVLGVAGILWAIAFWHDERIRLLLLYVAIGLLTMTVKLQKETRFVLTIVPGLYLLIGAMAAWLVSKSSAYKMQVRVAAMGAILCATASGLSGLIERYAAFPLLMQVEYETAPRALDLATWIATQIAPERRVYLLNPWDQFSSAALAWQLATQNPPAELRWDDIAVPSTTLRETTPERLAALRQAICQTGIAHIVALEGGLEGQPIPPQYTNAESGWMTLIARFEFVLEQQKRKTPKWLQSHLLTRTGLETVMAANRNAMRVTATVYTIDREACTKSDG